MNPEQLISNAGNLVSLPEVCIRINEMVDDERCSAGEIGDVIIQDTALSGRLLKIVNSAYFGLPGKVETISRAVTLIGTRELRDMALATAACDLFTGIPAELINMDSFWHASLTCGVVARALGKECSVLHPERLFVMGVLHDIGRLVILQQLPEESRDVILITKGRDELLPLAENEILGFNHSEVGEQLAHSWSLPESMATVIRWHHEPENTKEFLVETALVHIGSVVADQLVWEGDLDRLEEKVSAAVWKSVAVTPEACQGIAEEAAAEIRELYSLIVGPSEQVNP